MGRTGTVPQFDPAPLCRRSAKVAEVVPLMYLHGMSSGDFASALEGFFGSAAGLSASVIARPTKHQPGEHWIHLKSTNPIESTFATVLLRLCVTEVAGSLTAGLAMAIKLIESAQQQWRAVNAPHLGPLSAPAAPAKADCSSDDQQAGSGAAA